MPAEAPHRSRGAAPRGGERRRRDLTRTATRRASDAARHPRRAQPQAQARPTRGRRRGRRRSALGDPAESSTEPDESPPGSRRDRAPSDHPVPRARPGRERALGRGAAETARRSRATRSARRPQPDPRAVAEPPADDAGAELTPSPRRRPRPARCRDPEPAPAGGDAGRRLGLHADERVGRRLAGRVSYPARTATLRRSRARVGPRFHAMDYAIIKLGNKQHRVRDGETLVVDRLRDRGGQDVPAGRPAR